jgi:hypothetical protein
VFSSLTAFTEGVRLNKTGEPDLPSLLYKIGLPQDGDFEITISKGREEVFKDIFQRYLYGKCPG